MAKKNLDRNSFLSSSTHLKKMKVELDEGIIYVRELTAKGILEYNDKIEELKKINPELTTSNSLELIAVLVSKSACDSEGNLLFTEADVNDLMNNSISSLKLIAEKAMEVSGVSQSAIEEATKALKKEVDSSGI